MRTHPIIGIGDTHLHPGERNADRRRAVDQIIAESLRDTVAAWVWLGDIFHAKSTIDDRNWWKERVKQQAAVASVVIIKGNHDAPGDLDIFGDLRGTWPVTVVTEPAVHSIPLATRATAAICGIPYPSSAGLVAAGVSSMHLAQEAALAFDSVLMGMAMEAEQARARGDLVIVAGHGNLAGAISSVGQPQIGQDPEIDPVSLARFGRVPKLFGHIHKAQRVHDAIYAGSNCRMGWGEIEEKHYLHVDLRDDNSYTVTERPLDVAPMWHVEGRLTREGFAWQVLKGDGGVPMDPPASWAGQEVRVRYTYDADLSGVLDVSLVTAPFLAARRLHRDPVAVRVNALRAPEVALAVTLPEKFAAYCTLKGTVATPSALEKLARVQSPQREAVPAEVAAYVASLTTIDAPAAPLQEVLR